MMRDFLMHWITKPGASRPEMWRITAQACHELLTIPGARNCGAHIGQAMSADEPYGIYGPELEGLCETSDQVLAALEGIDGIAE